MDATAKLAAALHDIAPMTEFITNGITDAATINHLSNLRPVWAKDNIAKGSRRTSLL